VEHLDRAALDAGLDHIRDAPKDNGRVELIVRRPRVEAREVLREAALDTSEGLVGDCWRTRGSSSTADGSANPATQLTLMNVRSATLVAGDPDRRQLAGDQLFVDLDLSVANLPPGSRLRVGGATIEITALPHRGCGKFQARFGTEALKWVNSPVGRELNLRGVNARVVAGGAVRPGDEIAKLS
jgi:MOSC domain-containing protein